MDIETSIEKDEPEDLRSAVSAAFDAADKQSAPEPEVAAKEVDAPAAPEGETETQRAERERDEKGRFAKKDGDKPEAAPPKEAAPAKAEQPVVPPAPVEFAKEGVKPPTSWRPAVREHFAKLPPEVQQEVLRRERDISTALQESAEARNSHSRLREAMAPYEPMLRAQNTDPIRFAASMAQTVASLSTGAPVTRAQIVAQVIRAYQVDVPTLASILSGETPEGSPAAQQPYRDPRVDELYQTIQAAKAQRAAAMEAQARTQIQEIEGEEFFEDLREDMADLLEVASRRGVVLTPKEAYHRAALMHPEISSVMRQREAAKAAVAPSQATQRSRAAASSVRASPAPSAPSGSERRSLRDEIAAAWDSNTQSR